MQLGFSVKGVGRGKSHLHLFYKISDVEMTSLSVLHP